MKRGSRLGFEATVHLETARLVRCPFAWQFAQFLESKVFHTALFLLILVYCVLSYFTVSLGSLRPDSLIYFLALEFCLHLLFGLELASKIAVHGVVLSKQKFASLWNLVDAVVVNACVALTLAQTLVQDATEIKYLKWICLGRLLRVLPGLRQTKADFPQRTKPALTPSSPGLVSTAAQGVVDVLQRLRASLPPSDSETEAKLLWCIDVISHNRLYEVSVNVNSRRRSGEILPWIRNFSKQQTRRHSSDLFNRCRSDQLDKAQLLLKSSQPPQDGVPDEVSACLRLVLTREFDVFALKTASQDNELLTLMIFLFTKSQLLAYFPEEQFRLWTTKVQRGYIATNPYHCATHAADVLQTMHQLLVSKRGCELLCINLLDVACCYIAAAIHDFQHPGLSNKFLVATRHPLATLYNDHSVLENHHLAAAFKLAEDSDKNLFGKLNDQDFAYSRRLIIELVLATDISHHFSDLSRFRSRFKEKKETLNDEDKLLALQMLLHCSDISNPSKPWPLCLRWAGLIMQEFFAQGDREKVLGMPVSELCDRETTVLSKCQMSFIDVIVMPTFEALSLLLPAVDEELKALEDNRDRWREEDAGSRSM